MEADWMKKKIMTAAVIFLLTALAGTGACMLFFRPLVVPFTGADADEQNGDIGMHVLFPVSDKSCEYVTVVIENGSGERIEFGDAWFLEKNVLGCWMQVQRKGDYIVESILRVLQPGGKYAFDCWLTGFQGEIEDGEYRIVKEISGQTYAAEFSIGESEITLLSPFGYEPAVSLGYSVADAKEDGACGLTENGVGNEENLLSFLEASQIHGLQAQVRFYEEKDDGELYFADVVKLKSGAYRVIRWEQKEVDRIRMKMYASSDSHAFEKYRPEIDAHIDMKYYSYLVTDGKAIWLSAYSDLRDTEPDSYDLCLVPQEYVSDDVRNWIDSEFTMQTEELEYSVWNSDGTRRAHTRVNPDDEDHRSRYFIGIYNERGYETRGYTCGVNRDAFDPGKKGGFCEFVWTDAITVMARADDGKGNYYYEFYDTEDEERLSYTVSQYDYMIEDGEIVIPE